MSLDPVHDLDVGWSSLRHSLLFRALHLDSAPGCMLPVMFAANTTFLSTWSIYGKLHSEIESCEGSSFIGWEVGRESTTDPHLKPANAYR